MRIVAPLTMYLSVIGLCVLSIALAEPCGSVNCKDPANANNASCIAEKVVADCTSTDVQTIVTTYGPAIRDAINGDDASLENAALKFGGCAVSEVFGKLVFGKMAAMPGSGAGSTASPADARARYDRLRAKMWPTTTFKTTSGSL